MGKDHIWDSTQWDKETGPKDDRIQHSWDRETRPKDHIWAKTIYGIQHSGTRKPDPKTIGFNTVGTGKPDPKTIYGIQHSGTRKPDPKTIGFNTVRTGKPDPKTIYGQRPYMGFNTEGQGNRTQRPYMGKDHIWDSTQWDKETRPKDNRIQRSWDRETRPKDHIWAKTIYGIQHRGIGKPDPNQRPYLGKDHIWDSTQWDKETGPKDSWI